MMPNGYFFDTSFFAEGMKRYPPGLKTFSPIWTEVDHLIDNGRGFCCREVLEELEQKAGDDAHAFVKERKEKLILAPSEAEEKVIVALVSEFADSGWSLATTKKDNADPWVVAFAKTKELVAVTAEFRRSNGRLIIPDACEYIGAKCSSLLEFIAAYENNSL
ncbi:MAG: DUF4411 family protein [Planctomycetes bacterium]|nr:DUF4411 family protein [Planctomycetota bacterium]